SHKEKVEEYNKYLASLSEHHDMLVSSIDRVLGCLWLLTLRQASHRTWLTRVGSFRISEGIDCYLYTWECLSSLFVFWRMEFFVCHFLGLSTSDTSAYTYRCCDVKHASTCCFF